MTQQLTHEQVDALEDKLREAEKALEEAGRILCPIPGGVAPQLWRDTNRLIGGVREIIHECYKLRPEE